MNGLILIHFWILTGGVLVGSLEACASSIAMQGRPWACQTPMGARIYNPGQLCLRLNRFSARKPIQPFCDQHRPCRNASSVHCADQKKSPVPSQCPDFTWRWRQADSPSPSHPATQPPARSGSLDGLWPAARLRGGKTHVADNQTFH